MSSFALQIVTPDRQVYDGQAQSLIVRTMTGDVCILNNHLDYAAPVIAGEARVRDAEGNERVGACAGGLLSVYDNHVRLIATTFEWQEEIDLERAQRAENAASERLSQLNKKDAEYSLVEAKLKRAVARIHAVSGSR